MEAIVLTSKQNTEVFKLIKEFFGASVYGSFENFQIQEERNISSIEIENSLFIMSVDIINDPKYLELRNYIFSKVDFELLIRLIDESEMKEDPILKSLTLKLIN
jgi:hypothetical protein